MKKFTLVRFFLCILLVWSEKKIQTSNSEEEECRNPQGLLGICVLLTDCPNLYKITDGDFLQNFRCGTTKNLLRVCCLRSDVVKSPKITDTNRFSIFGRNNTSKYPITNPYIRTGHIDCGHTMHTGRGIMKAEKSELGAWPWLAAIYYWRNSRIRETICSGALVTNKHIITAAHCTVDVNGNKLNDSTFTVRLGEYKLNIDNDGACPLDFFVKEVRRHPNFKHRTYENDIAILVLREMVSFTDYIQPICLPYEELANEYLIQTSFIAGWGDTTFEGNFHPDLMEMKLFVWNHDSCSKFPQKDVLISENHLCGSITDTVSDSCQGDSGGPLMFPIKFFKDFSRFYLVGVLSYGKQCAITGYPNIYSRVASYIEWININLL